MADRLWQNPDEALKWAHHNSRLVHTMRTAKAPLELIIAELVKETQSLRDELVRIRSQQVVKFELPAPPPGVTWHVPNINPDTPR